MGRTVTYQRHSCLEVSPASLAASSAASAASALPLASSAVLVACSAACCHSLTYIKTWQDINADTSWPLCHTMENYSLVGEHTTASSPHPCNDIFIRMRIDNEGHSQDALQSLRPVWTTRHSSTQAQAEHRDKPYNFSPKNVSMLVSSTGSAPGKEHDLKHTSPPADASAWL
jgi:hypothetical protein